VYIFLKTKYAKTPQVLSFFLSLKHGAAFDTVVCSFFLSTLLQGDAPDTILCTVAREAHLGGANRFL